MPTHIPLDDVLRLKEWSEHSTDTPAMSIEPCSEKGNAHLMSISFFGNQGTEATVGAQVEENEVPWVSDGQVTLGDCL